MAEPVRERYSPLLELTLTRLREFFREPGALFWVFGFPLVLGVGLGIAFRNRPPEKPRIAVPPEAAWVLTALRANDSLQVDEVELVAAQAMLHGAKVDLVVAASVGEARGITYHFDPMRPEGRLARLAVDAALQRSLGRVDVLAPQDAPVTEKGSRYVDFLFPALIGMNVMGSSMWGIGYNVVLQRRRKLLKRLAATPMRRAHYLLSFVLSRLVFLTFEVSTLVFFGWLVFDVSPSGSYAAVALLAVLGAAAFAGLALVIAARVESVEVASGWMNFAMLPMWLLSGSFFSYERFPAVVHPAIQALPLTAVNDSLRAVFNHGAGIFEVWPQIAVLSAWLVVCLSVAVRTFRWQ